MSPFRQVSREKPDTGVLGMKGMHACQPRPDDNGGGISCLVLKERFLHACTVGASRPGLAAPGTTLLGSTGTKRSLLQRHAGQTAARCHKRHPQGATDLPAATVAIARLVTAARCRA